MPQEPDDYSGLIETIEAYQKGGKQGLLELAKKRDEESHRNLLADLEAIEKAGPPKPPSQQ